MARKQISSQKDLFSDPLKSYSDLSFAFTLAIFFSILYALTIHSITTWDGVAFISDLEKNNLFHPAHVFYLPALKFFIKFIPFLNLSLALNIYFNAKLFSVISASSGLFFMFLFCRNLNLNQKESFLTTALLGFSLSYWFYACHLEVHSFHLLIVLFALWLFSRSSLHPFSIPFIIILCLMSHITAFLLVPSLFFLIWQSEKKSRPLNIASLFLTLLLLIIFSAWFIFWQNKSSAYSWWLWGSSFLTIDLGNIFTNFQTLLRCGFLSLILLPLLLFSKIRKQIERNLFILLFFVGIPYFCFSLFWVPDHGAFFLPALPICSIITVKILDLIYREENPQLKNWLIKTLIILILSASILFFTKTNFWLFNIAFLLVYILGLSVLNRTLLSKETVIENKEKKLPYQTFTISIILILQMLNSLPAAITFHKIDPYFDYAKIISNIVEKPCLILDYYAPMHLESLLPENAQVIPLNIAELKKRMPSSENLEAQLWSKIYQALDQKIPVYITNTTMKKNFKEKELQAIQKAILKNFKLQKVIKISELELYRLIRIEPDPSYK